MNDLVLPPAYQAMLKQACERAYRKGIKRGKRIGHTSGHAAGRDELLSGLKALAHLNGSAQPVMKSFNPDQPRNKIGEWTSGAEVAEAAADPAKAKELAAGMDSENKQKLAAAIAEHKGEAPKEAPLTSESTAAEGKAALERIGHAYRASGGLVNNPKGYGDAVKNAAAEIGKLTREELTKVKEAVSVKVGGKKAEMARVIAERIISRIGAAPQTPAEEQAAKEPAAPSPVPAAEQQTAPEPLPPKGRVLPPKKESSYAKAERILNEAAKKAIDTPIPRQPEVITREAPPELPAPEPRPETRALMGQGEGEAAPDRPAHQQTRHEYVAAARSKITGDTHEDIRRRRGAEIQAEAEHFNAVKDAARKGQLSEEVLNSLPLNERAQRAIDQNHATPFAPPAAPEPPADPGRVTPDLAGDLPRPTKFGDEPHYVTGGNTYQHRERLSAIGARWDIPRRRWVIPKAALHKLPPGLHGVPL